MDSLKTLLDQKKYDLVLKLTESSLNDNDLFYRISAFIYLGKYEYALFVIQDHQRVLESNLHTLINAHINLLCALGRYEQAYSVLDYYSNLPYQSQVVEETLRKMPEVIASEEKKNTTFKGFDDEKLDELLNSNNDEDVLLALDVVKTRDVFNFLPSISKILISYPRNTIRSYALMLLVKKEVDRNLKMLKNGTFIDVNPKHLEPPFTGSTFNETIRIFDHGFHDPSLAGTATQLFSQYCISLYPNKIEDRPKDLAFAFYAISREYINSPLDNLDLVADEQGLDIKVIKQLIEKIKETLKDF